MHGGRRQTAHLQSHLDSSNNGGTFTHTYRAPVVESGTVVLTFKFIASDSNWVVDKIVTVTVYAP